MCRSNIVSEAGKKQLKHWKVGFYSIVVCFSLHFKKKVTSLEIWAIYRLLCISVDEDSEVVGEFGEEALHECMSSSGVRRYHLSLTVALYILYTLLFS